MSTLENKVKEALTNEGYRLRHDILAKANAKGFNPCTIPFVPGSGLKSNARQKEYALFLKSSDYGAFADHVAYHETLSARWAKDVVLTIHKKEGNVFWYLLLDDEELIIANRATEKI